VSALIIIIGWWCTNFGREFDLAWPGARCALSAGDGTFRD